MRRLIPLALLLAPAAAAAESPAPRTGTELLVVATGSVERRPDLVTFGAGVVAQAAGARDAMVEAARRTTAVIAALRIAGVAEDDIRTSAITLGPRYRYDQNQPPVLLGYEATNRVSVRLHDLARAGATLDALVRAGANQVDGPEFALDRPEVALDEARIQAIATARARAELYARAAGLTVRRIVRISEADLPEPVRVFAAAPMARAAAKTPVEAGQQTMSVTVQVSFELG